jgi:energy-coupling factor transporter ATP-binding protein EcfA2
MGGHASMGFPRELLNQPWTARLQYFRTYTMAHPCLVDARDGLVNAIHEVPTNSLILVLGPTGVGKTTLRAKIEQLLTAEMLPSLSADSGRIPVVSVECVAPEAGSFSWRAHFRRLLLQMEEPLVDYKIDPEAPVRIANMVVRFTPSEKAVGAEYQHAVERALAFRRPTAVLIDEAQHLAKMGSGRRLADQLDVIKSLANRTKTVHVLFGTYELLAFRNLSAQLSRRSIDIHFPRYRLANPGDETAFRTVLRSFEQQLPLREQPDLVKEWEYLYERSVGCVGILKDWLMRALVSVSRSKSDSLRRKDLEPYAPTVAQCDKMLSEALEGESRLMESTEERSRLRARLGLNPSESIGGVSSTASLVQSTRTAGPRANSRKPGQRRPTRDPIGTRSAYANASGI